MPQYKSPSLVKEALTTPMFWIMISTVLCFGLWNFARINFACLGFQHP